MLQINELSKPARLPKVDMVCRSDQDSSEDGWASRTDWCWSWARHWGCTPSECDCRWGGGVEDGGGLGVVGTGSSVPFEGVPGLYRHRDPWLDYWTSPRMRRKCWDSFAGYCYCWRERTRPWWARKGAEILVVEAWPSAALLHRQIIKNYQLPSMKLNHKVNAIL